MEKASRTACESEKSFSIERLKAIGVTNQRETIVVWDRASGKPLHNAVVWLDTRTSNVVQSVAAELGNGGVDALRTRCGLPIATYFSAVKLRWLYENVDVVRSAFDNATCLVGTVDSWIIWVQKKHIYSCLFLTNNFFKKKNNKNLTGGASGGGVHVTDVTNASRTLLMSLQTNNWDDDLCRRFKTPRSILPSVNMCRLGCCFLKIYEKKIKIKSSSEIYGRVASGSLKGIPISGVNIF